MNGQFNFAVPFGISDDEYNLVGNALDFVKNLFPGSITATDPGIQNIDALPDLPPGTKAFIVQQLPTGRIIRAAFTSLDQTNLQNTLISAILNDADNNGSIPVDPSTPSTGLLGIFSQPNFVDLLSKLGINLNTFFAVMAIAGAVQIYRGKNRVVWGGISAVGSYNYLKTKV